MIEVRLFASLRQYRPSSSDSRSNSSFVTVDVPDKISLSELLDEMEMNAGEVKLAIVNGMRSRLEQILVDGDRVDLFPSNAIGK